MTELLARIHDVLNGRKVDLSGHRLGLYRQVELALILLRQDMVQTCAADLYAIFQATISRIWRRILPLLDEVLILDGISLDEAVAQGEPVLIDGTFIPTGNRPASRKTPRRTGTRASTTSSASTSRSPGPCTVI